MNKEYYFAHIQNNILLDISQVKYLECLNVEVAKEYFDNYIQYGSNYYIVKDSELVINPNWEEEQKQKERERLDALYMTRSDFFDGMIMAFGLGQTELRTVIEQILNSINITDIQVKVALNNYDNALNFYRKHTLFTLLNNIEIPINDEVTLIFTSDIWDKFFETKDYKELQKAIKVLPEPVDDDSEVENDTNTL